MVAVSHFPAPSWITAASTMISAPTITSVTESMLSMTSYMRLKSRPRQPPATGAGAAKKTHSHRMQANQPRRIGDQTTARSTILYRPRTASL